MFYNIQFLFEFILLYQKNALSLHHENKNKSNQMKKEHEKIIYNYSNNNNKRDFISIICAFIY